MITWVENKRKKLSADVYIRLANNKRSTVIAFTPGAMASKLKHSESIEIGYDPDERRVYFKTGLSGYTAIKKGQRYYLFATSDVLKKYFDPADACGTHALEWDEESRCWYIALDKFN